MPPRSSIHWRAQSLHRNPTLKAVTHPVDPTPTPIQVIGTYNRNVLANYASHEHTEACYANDGRRLPHCGSCGFRSKGHPRRPDGCLTAASKEAEAKAKRMVAQAAGPARSGKAQGTSKVKVEQAPVPLSFTRVCHNKSRDPQRLKTVQNPVISEPLGVFEYRTPGGDVIGGGPFFGTSAPSGTAPSTYTASNIYDESVQEREDEDDSDGFEDTVEIEDLFDADQVEYGPGIVPPSTDRRDRQLELGSRPESIPTAQPPSMQESSPTAVSEGISQETGPSTYADRVDCALQAAHEAAHQTPGRQFEGFEFPDIPPSFIEVLKASQASLLDVERTVAVPSMYGHFLCQIGHRFGLDCKNVCDLAGARVVLRIKQGDNKYSASLYEFVGQINENNTANGVTDYFSRRLVLENFLMMVLVSVVALFFKS